MHSLITQCLNNNKKLYLVFIEFRRFKLIESGIRGKILNLIQSMYKSSKSSGRFNIILIVSLSAIYTVVISLWQFGSRHPL